MSGGRSRALLVTLGGASAFLLATPGTALAAAAQSPTITVSDPLRTTATISVSVDQGGGAFTITGPASYGYAQNIPSSSSGTTGSCSFDPRSNGCGTGSTVLPNGTYTISATSSAYRKCGTAGLNCTDYSATSSSRTFVVSAPPAKPTGVVATLTGSREVTVSWTPNAEPDITGYDLLDASGGILLSGVTCAGTDCHVALTYADDDPGGTKEYAVAAHRPDGSGGDLSSGPSSTASATLPAPASTGSSGSGGGSGGTTSGSTPTGSGASGGGSGTTSSGSGNSGGGSGGVVTGNGDQGTATSGGTPAYNGYSGRPGLGLKFTTSGGGVALPKLPGGTGNLAPQIPEGTFDPALPYSPKVDLQKTREQTLSTRFVTTIGSAFTDTSRLFRSLAVALVLVLIGMHVRLWARTTHYE